MEGHVSRVKACSSSERLKRRSLFVRSKSAIALFNSNVRRQLAELLDVEAVVFILKKLYICIKYICIFAVAEN